MPPSETPAAPAAAEPEPQPKADPPPWAAAQVSVAPATVVSSPAPVFTPAVDVIATQAASAPPTQLATVPERTLADQMEDLERWAANSQRRIRVEEWRAVLVRTCALASVLGAAIVAQRGQPILSALLAAACALLVILETAWPGLGSGRAVRQQAINDLRELQNGVKLQWDRVRLTHADPTQRERVKYAIALLDAIRGRREQIARRLSDIEPSPPIGRGTL